MKTTTDAVVVGGGVMGCSILYNLATLGLTNALLLERDVLASGSTSRSQAILRMHYSNEVTTRMAWESLKIFQEFDQIVGGDSGYVRTGYLLIVGHEHRVPMEKNVAMQRRIGVQTETVSVEDVLELAPVLAVQEDEAFAYEPQSGYADPYSVTTGYARAAREMGAQINTNTPVYDIEITRGKVTAVVTSQGRVETPIVVVAAGPWSAQLLSKVRVDLPLRSLRHQVIMLRRPEDQIPSHPILGDVVNAMSPRPDVGNLTLVGVGEEEFVDPDEYNQGVDMPLVEKTLTKLVRRMPGMSQALFRGGWSGLFTTTPDWHPILDKVEGIDGLYCAVGFSGHGFKLSPMIGLTMAELVVNGRATTVDVSMLGIGRFATGNALGSSYSMSVLA